MVLASLAFVKQMAELQVQSIRTLDTEESDQLFTVEEAAVFRDCRGRALVLHLSGLISFGAANDMTRRMSARSSYELLLVDLQDVPRMDGSAALALEALQAAVVYLDERG